MNALDFCGDLSYLLAVLLLLAKIWKTRSCAGVSGKSQIIFAIVCTTRYLVSFTSFVSVYNSVMRVMFMFASYGTLYLMYFKFKSTYDHNDDNIRIVYIISSALVLSFFTARHYTVIEILWTYSIYLEAVAIALQLFMMLRTGEVQETVTRHYLCALGSYIALYLMNWIPRNYAGNYPDWIVATAGIVLSISYSDFLVQYVVHDELDGHQKHLTTNASLQQPGYDENANREPDEQKAVTQERNEQKVVTREQTELKVKIQEQNEQKVVTHEQIKQKVVAQEQNEQKAVTQEQNKQEAVTHEQTEHKVVAQEQNEETLVTQKQNDQKAVTQKQTEQKMVAQEQNEQKAVTQERNTQKVVTQEQTEQKAVAQKQTERKVVAQEQTVVTRKQNVQKVVTQVTQERKEQKVVTLERKEHLRVVENTSYVSHSRASNRSPCRNPVCRYCGSRTCKNIIY